MFVDFGRRGGRMHKWLCSLIISLTFLIMNFSIQQNNKIGSSKLYLKTILQSSHIIR